MIDLWKFLNKRVRMELSDDCIVLGTVDMVWNGEECDDGKDSLGLSYDATAHAGEVISIDDIVSIAIV